jgi:tetratricopeptide (TPR) repeat protein
MLLCLGRPELFEAHPGWMGGADAATTLELGGLPDEVSERLLMDRADTPLDDDVRLRIIEIAEGNPLFLEELLSVARAVPGRLEMPRSIQAVLTARIEALAPEEQRVAELASIHGKEFPRSGVGALSEEAAEPHLASLESRHIVVPVSGDEAAFRHQLIRDAVYRRIPKGERALLHRRAATWLGTTTDRADRDELVGYHLETAVGLLVEVDPGDPGLPELREWAAEPLSDAGRRSFARSDMPAAANLLGRAHALLEQGHTLRLEIAPDLGAALAAEGEVVAAEDLLTGAVDEARRAANRSAEAHATAELLLVRLLTDPEMGGAGAVDGGRRLLDELAGTAEDRVIAKAWYLIGLGALYASRFEEMETAMRRSLEHAERAGDDQQRSTAIQWLASAISRGPTPASDGIGELEGWLASAPGWSAEEAGILVNLGVLYGVAGRIDEARRSITRGREIFASLGHEVMRAVYAMELSDAERFAGDASPAIVDLEASRDTLAAMGERDYLSTVCAYLARSLAERGEFERAEEMADEAETAAAEDDMPSQISIRAARSLIAGERGDVDGAERFAREALELAETGDDPVAIGDMLVGLSRALARSGEPATWRPAAERAVALFERKGAVVLAADAGRMLAEPP